MSQKRVLRISPTAGSLAEDKDYARELRLKEILPSLKQDKGVVLDFRDTKYVTQSFVHALVGEALKRYGGEALENLEFRSCAAQVRSTVELVVDYSLGGFSNGAKNNSLHPPPKHRNEKTQKPPTSRTKKTKKK